MFRINNTVSLLILMFVCLSTAASAQLPPTGYIGLYIDESRTSCNLDPGVSGQAFSFYIFCLPSENGLMCAEFAVSIPSEIVISNIVENEGVSLTLGDLADGLGVCFLECQNDWVYTHRVNAIAQSSTPSELLVVGHGETGDIQFANCDDSFPLEPVFVNPGIGINGPCVNDSEPPVLAELTVPDLTHMRLTFDEEIIALDADIPTNYFVVNSNNQANSMDISRVVVESRDPTRVLLTLERAMRGDESYTLFVNRVRDKAGNEIPPWSSIDVDLNFDIMPPEITGLEVLSDWTLIVRFSEPLIPETAEDRLHFAIYCDGSGHSIEKAEYLSASSSIRVSLRNQLKQKTVYSLQMWGMTDLAGNVIVNYPSIAFRAIDKVPPEFLSVVAFDPDHVTSLFDEPLDTLSSTDPGNYRIFESGNPETTVPIIYVEMLQFDRVKLALAYSLDEDTPYSIFASGVSDARENSITIAGITDIVQRPDNSAPYLVDIEYMKTSIPPHFKLTFNEYVVDCNSANDYIFYDADRPNGFHLFKEVFWMNDSLTVFGQLYVPLDEGIIHYLRLPRLTDMEGNSAPEGNRFRIEIKDPEIAIHSLDYDRGEVEISWQLSRTIDDLKFVVSRSEASQDAFSELPAEGLSNETLSISYIDPSTEPGRSYVYKIDYILEDERFNFLMTNEIGIPDVGFSLYQNWPNPFNPSTILLWSQPDDGNARIEIFDVAGHRVVVLENGFRPAGIHSVEWDGNNSSGNNMSSGVYFCRLSYGGMTRTRKMVLLR
ncbi:MAG: T9SS type A sorting domain-containing protein [Bacteroidales bacterium]|nr:T9SS type A sorting domain-containing protein [Candidatus Latescibacterota bacterium]